MMAVIPYIAAFGCGVFFGVLIMCALYLSKKGE